MARSIGLLVADDPDPVFVQNSGGSSPFLLIGDHAGRAIPQNLNALGLPPEELERHIAWDIGIAELGANLSSRLDATFISQRYSRLVIDCNRPRGAPGSILTVSDGARILGNEAIEPEEAALRGETIFAPYHQAIAAELDRRQGLRRRPSLIALHSFTPVMNGFARPWLYGVLHLRDSAMSVSILAALRKLHGDKVGDNQPYAMDGTDFTVPFHTRPRGVDYLEIEVRQDLLADAEGVEQVAAELASVLTAHTASNG